MGKYYIKYKEDPDLSSFFVKNLALNKQLNKEYRTICISDANFNEQINSINQEILKDEKVILLISYKVLTEKMIEGVKYKSGFNVNIYSNPNVYLLRKDPHDSISRLVLNDATVNTGHVVLNPIRISKPLKKARISLYLLSEIKENKRPEIKEIIEKERSEIKENKQPVIKEIIEKERSEISKQWNQPEQSEQIIHSSNKNSTKTTKQPFAILFYLFLMLTAISVLFLAAYSAIRANNLDLKIVFGLLAASIIFAVIAGIMRHLSVNKAHLKTSQPKLAASNIIQEKTPTTHDNMLEYKPQQHATNIQKTVNKQYQ